MNKDEVKSLFERHTKKNYKKSGIFLYRFPSENETVDKVEAFCYHGKTIEFVAPWGEKMLCEDGDYIARPLGGSPEDIYRIEKQIFNQTYTEIVT